MKSELASGRFHVVYILKFLRNGLVLCILPMIRALLRFDLASLYTALRQDALILLAMLCVSILLWQRGGYRLSPDSLDLHFGFVSWHQRRIPFREVAVVEQSRPLWLRLLGATRITFYSARTAHFKTTKIYLSRRRAAYLAETMLPVQPDAVVFSPSGGERLRFVMLTANAATSLALLVVSTRQTGELLGKNVELLLNHLALDNLTRIEQLVELFLPAGLAWLFTLICMLWGVAIFLSMLATSGFRVSRSGGVILARGGCINHTEQRVLASAISYCDVRQTPFSRLLRRFPVYLCAGSFSGGSTPFLIYKRGQEQLLQSLLPSFHMEALDPGPVKDRSWPMYIWKGSLAFGVSAILASVSAWQLPQITPLMILPLILGAALLFFGVEARFYEGAAMQEGGSIRVCYIRHFTRHELCILTRDLSLTTLQTPFSESIARCNLYINLPCRRWLRVRGMKSWQVGKLKFDR